MSGTIDPMSTHHAYESGQAPVFTLGDRLRKAREHAGLSQSGMAADVGISRGSVLGYESDKREPGRPVLVSWALRTGVPMWWLKGAACACGQPATHGYENCPESTPIDRRSVYNVDELAA